MTLEYGKWYPIKDVDLGLPAFCEILVRDLFGNVHLADYTRGLFYCSYGHTLIEKPESFMIIPD